jgi:hypothetical protein
VLIAGSVNLLLHPPRGGWPDNIVPTRFLEKYHSPMPRSSSHAQTSGSAPREPPKPPQGSQHAHNALTTSDNPPDGIEYDKDPRWVMDSGASMHICFDIQSFHTLDLNPYIPLPTVIFGSKHHLQAIGIGSVKLHLPGSMHSRPSTMILEDVLNMHQAAANLFSMKQV